MQPCRDHGQLLLHAVRIRGDRLRKIACQVKQIGIFADFFLPLIGWFCVRSIAEAFTAFQKAIPWIALALLLFIGGKMLVEGIKNRNTENREDAALKPHTLLVQGIATSIDALSVGFTIEDYRFGRALTACLIIAAVTFVICFCGLKIGQRFGTRLSWKATILGGVILIGIGIEIFITGLFGG